MHSIVQGYRIYKDRFLLSLSVSILFHALLLYFFFLLPTSEKKVMLRPVSLGVLQTQTKPQENSPTTNNAITQTVQKKVLPKRTQKNKKNPQKSQTTSQTPPITTTQTPITTQDSIEKPDLNVDLNALVTPENKQEFHPFVTTQPSLTQTLKEKQDNVKFEKLPKSLQDELYKLYGTQLHNMSKEEKDYLSESYFLNGEVFQQTADRVGYPKLAAQLKQQGNGVIEFTLYPDGHVENIKIIQSTTFDVLDDSLRQVVELSAKNLKRPPQPITIRLRGNYTMYPKNDY